MKRYIQEYLMLTLPRTEQNASYHQKIITNTLLKNVEKKQTLERQCTMQIQPLEYSDFEVRLNVENLKMQLDSTLKKQENLSVAIAGTLEKVRLRMNSNGLFTELLNHEEVLEKWYRIKPKLLTEFKGNAFITYMKSIERKIEDPQGLLHDMRQYRNYGLFFNELLTEHSNVATKSSTRERHIDSLFYERSMTFEETVLFDKTENGLDTLTLQGTLKDGLTPSEVPVKRMALLTLDANAVFASKHYRGTYQFQTETGLLEQMNVSIATGFGENYSKQQLYNLKRTN